MVSLAALGGLAWFIWRRKRAGKASAVLKDNTYGDGGTPPYRDHGAGQYEQKPMLAQELDGHKPVVVQELYGNSAPVELPAGQR